MLQVIIKREEKVSNIIGIAKERGGGGKEKSMQQKTEFFRTQITEFQPTYLHHDVTHVYVNEFVHVRGEPPSHRRVYPAYVNTIDGPKVKSHGRLAHVSCVISYENS